MCLLQTMNTVFAFQNILLHHIDNFLAFIEIKYESAKNIFKYNTNEVKRIKKKCLNKNTQKGKREKIHQDFFS